MQGELGRENYPLVSEASGRGKAGKKPRQGGSHPGSEGWDSSALTQPASQAACMSGPSRYPGKHGSVVRPAQKGSLEPWTRSREGR